MASTIYDDNVPPDATACLDDDQSVLSDPPETDDDDAIPAKQKESVYEAPKKKRGEGRTAQESYRNPRNICAGREIYQQRKLHH